MYYYYYFVFFHTRAHRIKVVVEETSKRAHSIGSWNGLCPF